MQATELGAFDAGMSVGGGGLGNVQVSFPHVSDPLWYYQSSFHHHPVILTKLFYLF